MYTPKYHKQIRSIDYECCIGAVRTYKGVNMAELKDAQKMSTAIKNAVPLFKKEGIETDDYETIADSFDLAFNTNDNVLFQATLLKFKESTFTKAIVNAAVLTIAKLKQE